jgi:hypothetical protein
MNVGRRQESGFHPVTFTFGTLASHAVADADPIRGHGRNSLQRTKQKGYIIDLKTPQSSRFSTTALVVSGYTRGGQTLGPS